MPTITGTEVDDELAGTEDADIIRGLGGDDVLWGFDGGDVLDPGTGRDTVFGGDGDDRILLDGSSSSLLEDGLIDGGAGVDRLEISVTADLSGSIDLGGATFIDVEDVYVIRNDLGRQNAIDITVLGDDGANHLRFIDTFQPTASAVIRFFGGGGDDHLISYAADSLLEGQAGNDVLNGNGDLRGGDGHDSLMGTGRLDGGSGDDSIAGQGRLIGGEGNDAFWITVEQMDGTRIDGGAGFDRIQVGPSSGAIEASFLTGEMRSGDATLLFTRIERLETWSGDDRVVGDGASNVIITRSGADTVWGGGGDDELDGGDGTDTAVFDVRFDGVRISYADGAIIVEGHEGRDTLRNFEALKFSDVLVAVGSDGRVIVPGQGLNGTDAADVLNGTAGPDTINGLGGNDILNGLDGADVLNGGDNQDILRGGAGSDRLDGGADYDRAMYSGGARQYGVTGAVMAGGTFTTTVANGREGAQTDTLVSIEEAVFLDGSLSFDRDGVAAQVMRLYDAAFNRVPDQAGFEVLHADLAAGRLTLLQLSTAFFNSAEFQATFGTLTNEQFVRQMYRFTLDREAEPAGLKVWIDALNGGMSRGQALLEFSESNEHRDLTAGTLSRGLFIPDAEALIIARLYDATYDRLPDVAGLEVWKNALESGTSLVEIARQFASAPEFVARFGYGTLSDRDFVEQLYRFNLNREGDAAGIQNWVNALASGLSRAELLLAFSESAEHVALTRDLWLGGIRFQTAASPALNEKDAGALTLPALEDHGAGDPPAGDLRIVGLAHAGGDWWV